MPVHARVARLSIPSIPPLQAPELHWTPSTRFDGVFPAAAMTRSPA